MAFTTEKPHYKVENISGFEYINPNANTGHISTNSVDKVTERVNVMACQIRVWGAKAPNWWDSSSASIFTETESIEIFSSYKELIETATIHIPRGSLLKKNFKIDGYDVKDIRSGNVSTERKDEYETDLKKITEYADLISDGMNVDKDGNSVFSLDAVRPGMGLIERALEDEKFKDQAGTNDIGIGQRIEIWLGYIYEKAEGGSDTVENQLQTIETCDTATLETLGLKMCFTGFITSISPSAPYEIKCENMASLFKKISSPKYISKSDHTVKDFLGDNGIIDIKKKTGISLFDGGDRLSINVGKVDMEAHTSVFDILSEWSKCGILCGMSADGKSLKVGRTLYSGNKDGSTAGQYMTNDTAAKEFIQMDWDVAEDKLSVFRIDKRFLAVVAKAWTDDAHPKQMKVTVRRNPVPGQENKEDEGEWEFVNEKEAPVTKKKQKKKKGTKNTKTEKNEESSGTPTSIKNKADLDTYHVVTFYYAGRLPAKGGLEKLKEAAKQFYTKYDKNGVNGSVSVFGDRYFVVGQTVGIVDVRVPEKNGYYMIESITTSFGSKGYRREIKFPYKVGKMENAKITYIKV